MNHLIGREYVTSVASARLISVKDDFSVWNVEEPARSPDLSNLDFYLWVQLKERVYHDNPPTVTDLKEAFDKEITSIGSAVTKAVIDGVKRRAQDCI